MTRIVAVIRGEGHHRPVQWEGFEQPADRVVDLADQRADLREPGAERGFTVLGDPPASVGRRPALERNPKGLGQAVVDRDALTRHLGVGLVVAGRVGLGRVERRVRMGERDDQEHGSIRPAPHEMGAYFLLDPGRRVKAKVVRKLGSTGVGRADGLDLGRLAHLQREPRRDPGVDEPLVVVVEIGVPVGAEREHARSEVLARADHIESVVRVHRREVHLADERGLVACCAQSMRDRPHALPERQVGKVPGRPPRLEAGEEPDAGRDARGAGAEGVVEHDAVPGERIERRGLEVAVGLEADLVVSLLVGHHEHDVRRAGHGQKAIRGAKPTSRRQLARGIMDGLARHGRRRWTT